MLFRVIRSRVYRERKISESTFRNPITGQFGFCCKDICLCAEVTRQHLFLAAHWGKLLLYYFSYQMEIYFRLNTALIWTHFKQTHTNLLNVLERDYESKTLDFSIYYLSAACTGSHAVQEQKSEGFSPFANLTAFCLLSHHHQQYIFQRSIRVHSQVSLSQLSSIYNLSRTHVTLMKANGVAQVYPRQKYLYYWWWCLNREKSSLMSSWVCKTVRWEK